MASIGYSGVDDQCAHDSAGIASSVVDVLARRADPLPVLVHTGEGAVASETVTAPSDGALFRDVQKRRLFQSDGCAESRQRRCLFQEAHGLLSIPLRSTTAGG